MAQIKLELTGGAQVNCQILEFDGKPKTPPLKNTPKTYSQSTSRVKIKMTCAGIKNETWKCNVKIDGNDRAPLKGVIGDSGKGVSTDEHTYLL